MGASTVFVLGLCIGAVCGLMFARHLERLKARWRGLNHSKTSLGRKAAARLDRVTADNFALEAEQVPEAEPADFWREVSAARNRTERLIASEIAEREKAYKREFAKDEELRSHLARQAKEQQLDVALTSVWGHVRYYPAWSKRQDFSQWNQLQLTDIDGGKTDGEQRAWVSFKWSGRTFRIDSREWSGIDGDTYVDLSLEEDSVEKFAVSSSMNFEDGAIPYTGHQVTAFRGDGIWAKMLIELSARKRLADATSLQERKEADASTICKRFSGQ